MSIFKMKYDEFKHFKDQETNTVSHNPYKEDSQTETKHFIYT